MYEQTIHIQSEKNAWSFEPIPVCPLRQANIGPYLNVNCNITFYIYYIATYTIDGPTRWLSWPRHCATNRKVDGVTGIFNGHNPSGRTMVLGLTHHLTEMSTRKTFQITNLMNNSFIFQQYICYTTLLNMFRAARCSSSGGQIISPQPLVSSPYVSSRTVCAYCTAAYRG